MTSFQLVLDTTPPAFTLAAERVYAGDDTLVRLVINGADADAIEARIWGSINPTDPANASYGEDESGAAWLDLEDGLFIVALAPGGGPQLSVRLRDDVWNESEVVSINIVLPAEEEVGPAPARSMPRPARRVSARTKMVRSRVRLRDRSTVRVRHGSRRRIAPSRVRHGVAASHRTQSWTVVVSSAVASARHRVTSELPAPRVRSEVRRGDDPGAEQVLELLDLL